MQQTKNVWMKEDILFVSVVFLGSDICFYLVFQQQTGNTEREKWGNFFFSVNLCRKLIHCIALHALASLFIFILYTCIVKLFLMDWDFVFTFPCRERQTDMDDKWYLLYFLMKLNSYDLRYGQFLNKTILSLVSKFFG